MRVRSVVFTLMVLGILSLFVGCRGHWAFDLGDYKYGFKDSFASDLEGIDKVVIRIRNGPIEIEIWDQDRIEISVEERIKASTEEKAKELADEFKLEGAKKGSRLVIEPDYGEFYQLKNRYYCVLDVKLPGRLHLELETHNGLVEVPTMGGDVYVKTHNANIELAGCEGEAELETHNGEVSAGRVGGELSVHTHNGEVTLEGARGSIDVVTHNGPVELKIDKDDDFDLEADTHRGRVTHRLSEDKFKVKREKRSYLEGTYGEGKNRIRITTHNGSVRIRER